MTAVQIADVNWLLSALAQATAAMIAIVGGLLVSRYVSLHAEQEAARRRVEDLGRREREARTDLDDAERALDAHYVDDALTDERVFAEIVDTELNPSVDGVLEALDRDCHDLNLGVLGERLDLMVSETRQAIEAIVPLVPDEKDHADWADFRRTNDLKPANRDLWQWVYDQTCKEKREEARRIERAAREAARRAAPKTGLAALTAGLSLPEPIGLGALDIEPMEVWSTRRLIRSHREVSMVSGLESQIAAAKAALAALAQERRLAEETYEATRQPEGFVLALRVMSMLAVVGMGVPVAVMGFGSMTLPAWARVVVVVLFFVGVALLMRFLFVYASFLREGGRATMPRTVLGLLRTSRRPEPATDRTSDERPAEATVGR